MAADIIKNDTHTWPMVPTSTAIAEEARTGQGGRRVHRSRRQRQRTIGGVLRRRLLHSRRANSSKTNAPAHRPWCGRWAGALAWQFHWPILA